jgi:hypothetical protein
MLRSFETPRCPAARSALAAVLVLSFLVAPPVRADDEVSETALTLSPQAEPVPALRYRLLPSATELNPGDAAPIYLRFYAEQNPEAKKQIQEKVVPWLEEPFEKFPVEEAGEFVRMFGARLEQLAFAARRAECDWAYTLPEQREEAFAILLPDVQELRTAARLLDAKVRVEVARGDFDGAIRSIQTGLAMARHLSEAPFMINRLVGITVAGQFLDRVEELISRPDAPNLYWALAALPRPLIDVRGAMETEQVVGEWVLPELAGLDAVGSSEQEWESRLGRLHERLVRIERELGEGMPDRDDEGRIPEEIDPFRSKYLPEARTFFEGRGGPFPDSDAELIVRFLAERNRQILDDAFKFSYLPISEALPEYARSDAAEDAAMVFMPFLPMDSGDAVTASVQRLHLAPARLDRRVAELRVVEAIRLHASANGWRLPESLDAIEVVTVPVDPISGKPFVYRVEGESATLDAPETAMPVPSESLPYRITIRK